MGVYVNGSDLGTLGFLHAKRAGDLTPVIGAPASVPIPGGFGARATGAAPTTPPRRITIPGTLIVDTPGAFVAALRSLVSLCAGGSGGPMAAAVVLSFSDADGTPPTVGFTAYLADATSFDRADPQEVATVGPLTLVFDVLDPLAYELTPQSYGLTTAYARGPLGTARVWPLVTLPGPFTSRTLTLADGANTVIASLTLTAPGAGVAGGESVEVDLGAELLTHVQGATRTPRAAWLAAGDFFALDPALRVAGVDPGLKVDAGTGTVTYARAWR